MKNKTKIILSLLFLLFVMPFCFLGAQEKKKKEEIRVPQSALLPKVNEDYFKQEMKKFTDWIDSFRFAADAKQFQRAYQLHEPVLPGHVQEHIARLKTRVVLHEDLEEVTRLHRSWYAQIYNESIPLLTISKKLVPVAATPDEQLYAKLKAEFTARVIIMKEILANPPKKIGKEEYDAICKKNQARRKAQYIRNYKLSQAAAAKKAREAANPKQKKTTGTKNTGKESAE